MNGLNGMQANLAPFAAVDALINQGISQTLANATASWQGGQCFGVIFNRAPLDGYLDHAVTADRQTVAMCIANAPGIAEGSTALVLAGQPCEVTGPVVADASGWATFPIVFLN